MWFAAMSDYREHPWIVHLVDKLLSGDPDIVGLLASNPFADRPPKWVRAELYRYRFTSLNDAGTDWWTRQRVATYLPPLNADDPALADFLYRHGWR
jgi:hypothetical protein